MEMYIGIAVFVMLFLGWVIVPTIIKKRHVVEAEDEET